MEWLPAILELVSVERISIGSSTNSTSMSSLRSLPWMNSPCNWSVTIDQLFSFISTSTHIHPRKDYSAMVLSILLETRNSSNLVLLPSSSNKSPRSSITIVRSLLLVRPSAQQAGLTCFGRSKYQWPLPSKSQTDYTTPKTAKDFL